MTTTPPPDDSTTERRNLLLTLLSRFERGVITDTERPLLRPLIEAEMRHGQAVIDQYTADAPWLKAAAEDHEALRHRATELDGALREVLAAFRHETHPGFPARQSEHVEIKRFERWQAILNHGATCPDGEPCPTHNEAAAGGEAR